MMLRRILTSIALLSLIPSFTPAFQGETEEEPAGDTVATDEPVATDEDADTSVAEDGDESEPTVEEKFAEKADLVEGLKALAPVLDIGNVNSALGFLTQGHGLQFLKDVKFELKAFDTQGMESTYGFSYDYSKNWKQFREGEDGTEWGVDLEFDAKGTVAFDKEVHNPENFLTTHFGLNMFRSSGGVNGTSSDALADELNDLEDVATAIKNPEELANSLEAKKLDSTIRSMLSNQLYVDFSLNTGLEANQTFTQKNFTYGAQMGVVYWPWDESSMGSTLNLFDYPFALLRLMTGYDDEFRTIGATMPSAIIGIDQVNPSGMDPRAVAGDTSDFARFRSEVAFRTPIALIGDTSEDASNTDKDSGGAGAVTLYFDATWRRYKEIGASSAIEAADLDRFDYVEVALRSSNGIFLSFTDGQLPFDLSDEQTLQVGFSFNL